MAEQFQMTVRVVAGRRGTGVPTTIMAVCRRILRCPTVIVVNRRVLRCPTVASVCRRVFTLAHLTVVNVKIVIFLLKIIVNLK